jgi:hypothetical protein
MRRERVIAIAEELEANAPESEAQAVLQSGAEVVECARLAANQAALYRLAAAFLRASILNGQPYNASACFEPTSEYYLTDIVLDEVPAVIPEQDESPLTKAANVGIVLVLIVMATLALIGLVSVVSWLR